MKKENYSKFTLIFTSLFFVILSAGCNSEEKKQALITEEKNKALEKYISNFSKEQLLSQLFLINIEGNRKADTEKCSLRPWPETRRWRTGIPPRRRWH